MTEPITSAAVKTAVKTVTDNKVLPKVIETAELAVEVPSKLILNQKLVVVLSVVAGGALGAGVLYGVNKIRNHGKVLVPVEDNTTEVKNTKK